MQYTIGKRFTRRQKKNEFIFCLYSEVGEGSHCEISVERDGSYWITPLEGNATSVNGDEIYEKTQLNHGDYLSLGINCSVEDDMVSYIEIYNQKWGGVPIFLFEVGILSIIIETEFLTSFLFSAIENFKN